MIKLEDLSDSIFAVYDRLKMIINRGKDLSIDLSDLKVLYQFNSIFSLEILRISIRGFRLSHGEENLKKELTLIISAIDNFDRFYRSNRIELDNIQANRLIQDELKPYVDSENAAYKDVLEVNKRLLELNNLLESTSWKLGQEHPEVKGLFYKEEGLKREKKLLKEVYLKKSENYEEELMALIKISSFKDTHHNFLILKEEIEKDYLNQNEIFSEELSPDFLEVFNEIFTPELNGEELKYLLNKTVSPGKKISVKKITKCFYFIHKLSQTIKDDKIRDKWLESILQYFDIEKEYFDKKKGFYEGTNFEPIIVQAFSKIH